MRIVKLYGELGKRFGRIHRLDVDSPAEAMRALTANFPEFKTYMIEAGNHNIGFQVINGNSELQKEEEVTNPASGEIKFIPHVFGSNAGTRILIGAVLVIAGLVITGGTFGAGAPVGSFMITAGIGLMLGGVVELLSPKPKVPGPEESPDNQPSYLFNGPVNTTAQGHPVPLCYGKLIVGGAIISAGLSTTQLKSGYKRVYTVLTKVSATLGGAPANWFKRVPFGLEFTYYYYGWTLVPYDS